MNIQEILEQHRLWLCGDPSGKRADLTRVDLRDADLRGAVLRCADLTDAVLRGAVLTDADLRGAVLRGAVGNMREVKSLFFDTWSVVYTADTMQIGCQWHSIEAWRTFNDDRIDRMDSRALTWWRKYKDIIFSIIDNSPAIGAQTA